ncbi:diacylglycerol kinase family protein [Echinicola jeungdonensis]|uniref:Diacylglycerol/lipid kinase family protein n=1 Tax=Echinicola jeungdonensis TaxID=709343 RepID=A0ABV5J490_9BACT|nr:diacylglycerol kinase family protein [Echinicola jeungdonensis]MDN3670043.1 diacylglycerol kinase family protein [Echinicola jeungdonensis]
MAKQFLCILNPISGGDIDRNDIKDWIKGNLHGIELTIWETTGDNDCEKIKSIVDESSWDGILIGGGDGTVKMVVSAILETSIPLGIIPLGSANGLATCLGIHGVSDAIYAVKKDKVMAMDLLRINGEISLHLSDFGFNAGLVKKFSNQTQRGMMSYFKSTLSQFFEMRPYRFEVNIDHKKIKIEAKMVVIANGSYYGTGANINPQGKMDDGYLEVIALNPDGLEDLVGLSLDLFRGELSDSPITKIWSGHEVEIKNYDGADFQIDGEVMPETEFVHVICEKQKVHFFSLIKN